MLLKAPGLIERVLRDNFKQQFENDSQLCFTFRLSYSLIINLIECLLSR